MKKIYLVLASLLVLASCDKQSSLNVIDDILFWDDIYFKSDPDHFYKMFEKKAYLYNLIPNDNGIFHIDYDDVGHSTIKLNKKHIKKTYSFTDERYENDVLVSKTEKISYQEAMIDSKKNISYMKKIDSNETESEQRSNTYSEIWMKDGGFFCKSGESLPVVNSPIEDQYLVENETDNLIIEMLNCVNGFSQPFFDSVVQSYLFEDEQWDVWWDLTNDEESYLASLDKYKFSYKKTYTNCNCNPYDGGKAEFIGEYFGYYFLIDTLDFHSDYLLSIEDGKKHEINVDLHYSMDYFVDIPKIE